MTQPQTLAEVKAGDEVATLAWNGGWGYFCRLDKVEKRTPKRVYAKGNVYDLDGWEIGCGTRNYRIRPAEANDLADNAAKNWKRQRQQEIESLKQKLSQTPECELVEAIAYGLLLDDMQARYALAQRIGLPTLQAFAEAVRKAQEKL